MLCFSYAVLAVDIAVVVRGDRQTTCYCTDCTCIWLDVNQMHVTPFPCPSSGALSLEELQHFVALSYDSACIKHHVCRAEPVRLGAKVSPKTSAEAKLSGSSLTKR